MMNRKAVPELGIYAYGLAAVALGVIGLVWGDFAGGWQRVPASIPAHAALAYLTAVCEFAAGAALLWRRTARIGAFVLTVIYSIFTFTWLAHAITGPQVYDSWGNVFEELSLAIAGLVLCAALAPRESPSALSQRLIARAYGICPVSFGMVHIVYLSGTAAYVPKWLPPGQRFWALATAVFFFMAAASILSGILAGLASRLLTVMMIVFEFLIWLPILFVTLHNHFVWAGNGISLAMIGAAWVVADSLNAPRTTARETAHAEQLVIS